MKQLSSKYQVIYIDYQHTLKDLIYGCLNRRKNIPVKRLIGLKKRLDYKDGVYIITVPPSLPINWIKNESIYHSLLKINNFILRKAVLKSMKFLGVQNPIVVNAFNPFYGIYNYGRFNESCHVYYCYDEIGHAQWMNKHGQDLEDTFAKKVDAVIVSSAPLLEKMKSKNKFSYLVQNGVDFQLFNKNTNQRKSCKIETIGYTGSIDGRLDYVYLEEIAISLPHIQFKLVGRIADEKLVKNLSKLKNVKLEPPVDYAQLPGILESFDLCLIPFIKNEFTRNIYPMKINEYLAAGKLTLMTNFTKLPEFDNIVFKENSAEDAVSLINNLNLSDPHICNRIEKGIAIAGNNSWESRAGDFLKIIERHRRNYRRL